MEGSSSYYYIQETETDNLLAPKATTAYVDAQLLLKSNTADMTPALAPKADKATTYTITQVDT